MAPKSPFVALWPYKLSIYFNWAITLITNVVPVILFVIVIQVLGYFLGVLGLKSVDVPMVFALPNLGWSLMNLFYCLAAFL